MCFATDWSCRCARLLLTVLMALAWCGWPALAAAQTPVASATAPTGDRAEDPAARVEQIQRCARALEALRNSIPRDTFDVSAIVKQTGNDPAALLAWVRKNTTWTPYFGCLRGPVGVLMDRQGNSLDRAALLAEMARLAGKTGRLAHAQLPADRANELLKQLSAASVPAPAKHSINDEQTIDELVRTYGQPFGLDPGELRRVAEGKLIDSQHRAEEIVGRAAEQSALVASWIAVAGAPGATTRANENIDPLRALEDHWWVQIKEDDNWQDLDPLAPAEQRSLSLTPDRTIDWQPKDGSLPLDASLVHEVELRVIIERFTDGKLAEQQVLKQVMRPAELLGEQIEFTNIPLHWPADLDVSREADPGGKLRALIAEQRDWVPLLRIGSRSIYQSSFNDAGVVTPSPRLDAFAQLGGEKGVKGALTGALDAFGGGESQQKEQTSAQGAGVLTAQWLEFEVRVPGRQPHVIRRQVFDLIGPAARAASANLTKPAPDAGARLDRNLDLMAETQILSLPCKLSQPFVDQLRAAAFLSWKDNLIAMAQNKLDAKQAQQAFAQLPAIPSLLYDLALARVELNPHDAELYLDQPNLLTLHQSLHAQPDHALAVRVTLDIVANEMAVRPGSKLNPIALHSEQGVIDTNIESSLMEQGVRMANVADRLAGHPEKSGWVVVRNASDAPWPTLAVTTDSRARIEADLARGYVAVVPTSSVAAAGEATGGIGWWRIDPRTGDTLGMGPDGAGAAMAEYALVSFLMFSSCMLAYSATHYTPGESGAQVIAGRNKALAGCAFASVGGALMAGPATAAVCLGGIMAGIGVGKGL